MIKGLYFHYMIFYQLIDAIVLLLDFSNKPFYSLSHNYCEHRFFMIFQILFYI